MTRTESTRPFQQDGAPRVRRADRRCRAALWRGMPIALSIYFAMAAVQAQEPSPLGDPRGSVASVIGKQVMAEAAWALKQAPVTVTATRAERSAGGLHDFYSEGDYWWPDPRHPDSPYVQRDGMTNPDNFVAHREAVTRFSRIMGALGSAYLMTGDRRFVRQASRHARAWFADTATRMNPSLHYGQAIHGRVTGRAVGVIDMIQMMEVAQSLLVMEGAPGMDPVVLRRSREWFAEYLRWVTTHPYGVQEGQAKNNHGTCWVMQVAVFARFTRDGELLGTCRRRFREMLDGQMAADGSFPLELRRTKPYGYSLFNLDAFATIGRVLSTETEDLWTYRTPSGASLEDAIAFILPYVRDKSAWPHPQDVMYWDEWPVAQPFLLFGALRFGRPEWFRLWQGLPHAPTVTEVIRNLPVRHPLIWLQEGRRKPVGDGD